MEDTKKFPLRMPEDLHARLVSLAKRERRSLHAEILWLLQKAVEDQEQERGEDTP
jgi:hypothetical protein